ncbi:DEAD/DEAH box helicase [Bacteroidia bacterium]|nr:DEAD/DEAH box helicase [Bacteroidia bacterium]MDB9881804.1 DEAD/DEAH box helicase [Bacteroidia bacterium]MDC1395019.1 DEAD/DEAH box helicase [Bacteroidia bacterium]
MAEVKTQAQILEKLGITKLNPMQEEAQSIISKNDGTVLLSPTGTGKTLAFLLPLIATLDAQIEEIQALIIAPTRELAIQIEQVIRDMGTGYKTNVVYGGRSGSQDRRDIITRPAILVGTPGRVADHLRRQAFDPSFISTLVLDEFDKSLEIGFEGEMIEILDSLPNLRKKVLTSATQEFKVPAFVGLNNPGRINYLHEAVSKLAVKQIVVGNDLLEGLADSLKAIGNKPGIIFCNYKDTINGISDFLKQRKISHGLFYGGLEQRDRERALIKFRNGTHQLLLATDLAARGIDVPEIKFIIHYELPHREQEFTHRNGRTARMNSDGTAYVLSRKNTSLPDYMPKLEQAELAGGKDLKPSEWTTLFITGGKKDKISKGDIAGMFMKQAGLKPFEVGNIEIKLDCAFVSIHKTRLQQAISKTNNTRVKKKKVRVSEV